MSGDTLLLVVLAAWLLIGLILAVVLGRRGHDPFGWLILGGLLGPLAILLALDSVDHDERPAAEVVVPPARHSDGRVDVLVGFDGSAASARVLRVAERLLGDRVDRLSLVTVLPYDSGRIDDRGARSQLLHEASLSSHGVGLEVVHGRPATALQQLAHREGFDLIVVGTSRPDRLHALGDVAVDLARDSAVPVLLVPAEQTGENDDHE